MDITETIFPSVTWWTSGLSFICRLIITSCSEAVYLRSPGIESDCLCTYCSLAGRYDNPIPTRFLAPIDCSKLVALWYGYISTNTQAGPTVWNRHDDYLVLVGLRKRKTDVFEVCKVFFYILSWTRIWN
jgi:hypothetical protein